MKSKSYILMQIREILKKNRGFCDEEVDVWMKENENKTVYELLTFKKEISQSQEYRDVSCMRWFREEDQ